MTKVLHPAGLRGEIAVMPSKSDLHRLLIAGFLAGEDISQIMEISEDVLATKRCLLELSGNDKPKLWCNESGSTLRFLLPVVAALGISCEFLGSKRLFQRPIAPLLKILEKHGVFVQTEEQKITITGKLKNGIFPIPGNISSQFITGLLFALPLCSGESVLQLTTPLSSKGYVGMSLQKLEYFGVIFHITPNSYRIPGCQTFKAPAWPLAPEADFSNAAFWLTAKALGCDLHITGLPKTSFQPDTKIVEILDHLVNSNKNYTFDADSAPDLVPIVAVAMALTPGNHHIINAARLREKECDRLNAMSKNLAALGVEIREFSDGLEINGRNGLRGGTVESHNDHRIAMAMAIAAVFCQENLTLYGAKAVEKSYPNFWDDYEKLSITHR